MITVPISKAIDCLDQILESVSSTHEPALIKGAKVSAVLVSLEKWNAIQETLHLLSVPGMRESIAEARAERLDDAAKKLDW